MNTRSELEIFSKISLLGSTLNRISEYDQEHNVFDTNQKINLKEAKCHITSLCDFIKLDLSSSNQNQDPNKIDYYNRVLDAVIESLTTANNAKLKELHKKQDNLSSYIKKIYKKIDPILTGLSIIVPLIFPANTLVGLILDSMIFSYSLYANYKVKKNNQHNTDKAINFHAKKLSELIDDNVSSKYSTLIIKNNLNEPRVLSEDGQEKTKAKVWSRKEWSELLKKAREEGDKFDEVENKESSTLRKSRKG